MTPYAVEWEEEPSNTLALAWLDPAQRAAVNAGSRELDRRMARDPIGEGNHLSEGLYQIHAHPFTAFYTVDEDNRQVIVTDLWFNP